MKYIFLIVFFVTSIFFSWASVVKSEMCFPFPQPQFYQAGWKH